MWDWNNTILKSVMLQKTFITTITNNWNIAFYNELQQWLLSLMASNGVA